MWKCNKLRQEILNRVKELGLWCLTPLSLMQKFISVILNCSFQLNNGSEN
jgi:hypothetical protein